MSKLISVKVHPRARIEKVEADGAGGYKVWTRAVPEDGAANAAVLKQLANHLGMPSSALALRRGATSRNKLVEIVK